MAVTTTKISSSMIIKVVAGTDAELNDILKSITLKNVKTGALEQDVHDVAEAVAAVLSYPVSGYFRQDLNELTTA